MAKQTFRENIHKGENKRENLINYQKMTGGRKARRSNELLRKYHNRVSLGFFENEEITVLFMLYDLTKVWVIFEKVYS